MLIINKGFLEKILTDLKVYRKPACSVVIPLFGKNSSKELSPTDLDIPTRMEEDLRQNDVIRWPRQVYKMTWPRKAPTVVQLFEELCPIVIFHLEERPGPVYRDAVICRLYLVIKKLNPRVSIEALASSYVET